MIDASHVLLDDRPLIKVSGHRAPFSVRTFSSIAIPAEFTAVPGRYVVEDGPIGIEQGFRGANRPTLGADEICEVRTAAQFHQSNLA